MSLAQSLAIAAAALVMSYASAGPPVALTAAMEQAHSAAARAEAATQLFLHDLIDCRSSA